MLHGPDATRAILQKSPLAAGGKSRIPQDFIKVAGMASGPKNIFFKIE